MAKQVGTGSSVKHYRVTEVVLGTNNTTSHLNNVLGNTKVEHFRVGIVVCREGKLQDVLEAGNVALEVDTFHRGSSSYENASVGHKAGDDVAEGCVFVGVNRVRGSKVYLVLVKTEGILHVKEGIVYVGGKALEESMNNKGTALEVLAHEEEATDDLVDGTLEGSRIGVFRIASKVYAGVAGIQGVVHGAVLDREGRRNITDVRIGNITEGNPPNALTPEGSAHEDSTTFRGMGVVVDLGASVGEHQGAGREVLAKEETEEKEGVEHCTDYATREAGSALVG